MLSLVNQEQPQPYQAMSTLTSSPPGSQNPASPSQATASNEAEDAGFSRSEDQKESAKKNVKDWCKRIKRAKEKFKDDFKRMRDNMNFTAGLQWPEQKSIQSKKYIANFILQRVNEKVAQLYARNPTAEYQRRKRLDYQLWDGKLETIQMVMTGAMQHPQGLQGLPPQAKALLMDFSQGEQLREQIDRVGKTLEILFQYQMDEQVEHEGEAKLQFKQLVRRAVICGVGYVQVSLSSVQQPELTSSGTGNTNASRAMIAREILQRLEDEKLSESDPQMETLHSLLASLTHSMLGQRDGADLQQSLVFDFIPATSIIPDPRCKSLKGFIGAKWLVKEYILPVSDINAIFQSDVKVTGGSGAKQYDPGGKEKKNPYTTDEIANKDETVCACLWEVFDKRSKESFFIVDGHDEYVSEPEPVEPCVRGFWNLVALTFNDIETEESADASIFPPSDVDLLRSAQQEWNRTREELKKHRKANAPGYVTNKGLLSENDKDALAAQSPNEVVELENVPQGVKLSEIFVPRPAVPIQDSLYTTQPLAQDIQATTGGQQPAPLERPNPTATGMTIEAQQAMTVTTSNIDDLDDCLSSIARISGEMMLKEFDINVVQQIVGPGAVWPTHPKIREQFYNAIYLSTKAASSGRPNKQVELRNWQIVEPMLQALGANPMFIVRETLRRLDDQLDPEQAFPLMPPQIGQSPAQQQGGQGQPGQPNPQQQHSDTPNPQNQPRGGKHQPSPQGQHIPGQTLPPQQRRPGPGVAAGRN